MNHAQLRQWFYSQLSESYTQGELQALYHWCVNEIEDWSRVEAYAHNNDEVIDAHLKIWKSTVKSLVTHKPIQYIFGTADFFGLRLFVDNRVLIPRPETEELVQLMLDREVGEEISILDIGTGSGCIPLALKSQRGNWKVYGVDVSKAALEVARRNSNDLDLDVEWIHGDILEDIIQLAPDVVVSNPPYIPTSMSSSLDPRVVDNEPHLALFSPDDDPFIFFKRITDWSARRGVKRVYFETHATQTDELLECLNPLWNGSIEVMKDISGKERFVVLCK